KLLDRLCPSAWALSYTEMAASTSDSTPRSPSVWSERAMSSVENLTGRWVGYYVQGGHERPISADLVQDGADVSGSMRDVQPDRECSLFEGAVEAGLPPGADEQIDEKLRSMVPDAGSAPIRWVSHLPEDSVLKGSCEGEMVTFTKAYMGT